MEIRLEGASKRQRSEWDGTELVFLWPDPSFCAAVFIIELLLSVGSPWRDMSSPGWVRAGNAKHLQPAVVLLKIRRLSNMPVSPDAPNTSPTGPATPTAPDRSLGKPVGPFPLLAHPPLTPAKEGARFKAEGLGSHPQSPSPVPPPAQTPRTLMFS